MFLGSKKRTLLSPTRWSWHLNRQPASTRKDTQPHYSSGKCKSKLVRILIHCHWHGYKKRRYNNWLVRMWSSWNPHTPLMGMQNDALEKSGSFSKDEAQSSCDPAIPFLGTQSRNANRCPHKHLSTNVPSSIMPESQIVESTQTSITDECKSDLPKQRT